MYSRSLRARTSPRECPAARTSSLPDHPLPVTLAY